MTSLDKTNNSNPPDCPLCGSGTHPYFSNTDYILECGKCGAIVDTRSSLDRTYYEKERAPHIDQEKISTRERNVSQRVNLIKALLNKKSSILDVGCGEGLFLKEIKGLVRNVTGLEPTEFYADYARKELKIDVRQGVIENTDFSEGSFDIITMFHVLEHFNDPDIALEKIYSWLRPGGSLVIEVPDITSPYARYKRLAWELIIPEHRFHFTERSLTGLLFKHSFIPVIIRNRDFDQYRVGIGKNIRKLLPVSGKIKGPDRVRKETKKAKPSSVRQEKDQTKHLRRMLQMPLKASLGWLVLTFNRGDHLFMVSRRSDKG